MKKNKPISVAISIAAYIAAIFVAVYVFRFFEGYSQITRLAIADLAATIFIFLTSVVLNNSSMYDPYWSVKPAVIVLYFTISVDPTLMSGYQLLFVLFVLLYGTRLTLNFYRGWPGLQHEDWRYVNFRKQFPKSYWLVSLGGIHLFPTIMVFLGCLPFIGVFSTPYPAMPWLTVAGLIVLFGSVLLAFVADEQLRKFRKVNKDGMINTGLWKYSRHPNYLGEILTWWGIFMVGLSYGLEYLWTGIGALAITIMFAGVSIPLMEKHLGKRRSWYADYKKSVPSILPIRIHK